MIKHTAKFVVLHILTLLTSSSVLSQNTDLIFEKLTVRDGLSNNFVTCILQDSQSFLWFGTYRGLNRYDGYNIKVYQSDPEDPHSLSHSGILSIFEDHDGYIWVGTLNGLNRLNPITGIFTRFFNDPDDSTSISDNQVATIAEDQHNNLWIGTANGLNLFDEAENSFRRFYHSPSDQNSLSHNSISKLYVDRDNTLWIGTGSWASTWSTQDHGGLNKLVWGAASEKDTPDTSVSFIHFYFNPPERMGTPDWVTDIHEDRTGTLWVATDAGLCEFDKKAGPLNYFQHDPNNLFSISRNFLKSITEDQQGNLWIGTFEQGLNRYNPKEEKFYHFKSNTTARNSLSYDTVEALYCDRNGMLWIGTTGGGINKINLNRKKFYLYQNLQDPRYTEELLNNILSVYEDSRGRLWLGNSFTIYQLIRKNGGNTWIQFPVDRQDTDLPIYSMIEDRFGFLWISFGWELLQFDLNLQHYWLPDGSDLSIGSPFESPILCVYIDSKNTMWVGTATGLHRLDRDTGASTQYVHEAQNQMSISAGDIRYILEDQSHRLWIGTGDGLNYFDRETGIFTRFQNQPGNPSSLINNTVNTIIEDRSGTLWIGTGGGLSRMQLLEDRIGDASSVIFRNYDHKDGLVNEEIECILEDERENLWLSTNRGITKFNSEQGTFRHFDETDGVLAQGFNNGVGFRNSRGEMFFGGLGGLIVFHPDSIKEDLRPSSVVVTKFQIFNQDTKLDTVISKKKVLTFPHNQNSLSFEYTVLDFRSPGKNNYAYMMENLEKDWSFCGGRRFASYNNLRPGKYVFRVKGSNSEGIWNENGASLRIIITPPWYASWWAYVLYGMAVIGLIFGIRSYELKRVRLKNQVKFDEMKLQEREKIDRLKDNFFTNISHEFRTPLTLILGPLNSLITRESESSAKRSLLIIRRNAVRLLHLINQLLDFSKLESGRMKLKARERDMVRYVKGILMSFQSLAEQKNITCRFTSSHTSIPVYIDRDKTEKIFSNLFSNAFTFTPEYGEISVSIRKGEKEVIVQVKDTGIGISPDKLPHIFDRFYQADDSHLRDHEGTGIGLALTKELVELHHGTISVTSREGQGTEFTLTLPLGKEHLQEDEIVAEDETIGDETAYVFEPDIAGTEKADQAKTWRAARLQHIVLLVEDNHDMRNYIREFLEPHYSVREAEDGEAGLEMAREIIPDLIVSDIMMPKKDGYQLCKELKKDQLTSHIPVILLTAKAEKKDKFVGLEQGADEYLIKPFDSQELLLRIKNLIAIRQKLREYYKKITSDPEQEIRPPELPNPVDQRFLEKAVQLAKDNAGDENFDVREFGRQIGMSGTQLRRKMSALLGQSPNHFIRTMRLKEAARMIRDEGRTVSEAAFLAGFNSLSYFSKCFRQEFGILPSEY